MNATTCVTCKHWLFYSGEEDWSEVTPGVDWRSSCGKEHWYCDGFEVCAQEYRGYLLKARECPDYVQVVLP